MPKQALCIRLTSVGEGGKEESIEVKFGSRLEYGQKYDQVCAWGGLCLRVLFDRFSLHLEHETMAEKMLHIVPSRPDRAGSWQFPRELKSRWLPAWIGNDGQVTCEVKMGA